MGRDPVSAWRLIVTDSESLSGVAPVCPQQTVDGWRHDNLGVYECCPGPHIECWTESNADRVLTALSIAEAEVCT